MPYPEQLSRGLVLVKWWLLAIPHYLVLGVFVGGGWYAGTGRRRPATMARRRQPGLIVLLVFFAASRCSSPARYPRGIFDFVLGSTGGCSASSPTRP